MSDIDLSTVHRLHVTNARDTRIFFSAFLAVAFINGEYFRIFTAINTNGLMAAIYATFDISAVIWFAMFMALHLTIESELKALGRRDYIVLAGVTVLVLVPISALAWLGLTVLSVYMILTTKDRAYFYHAMWITLALSISNFWSRLAFKFFLDWILRIDTVVVSFFTNVASHGNLIYAADGKTVLQVMEGCTSFNNMSLAFLAWIVARGYFGTRGLSRAIVFIPLLCASVLAINTIRIGIIVLWPETYPIAHGPFGAGLASWATSGALLLISIWGARKQ